jgi:exopolyphosphatase/guanosine-5'-triphosphate,3'-diphosphate pyrophosphatase
VLIAALDLGSNSFHLLLAEVARGGRLRKVGGRKVMLRLGEAVAASGRLQPETFTRALEATGELIAEARRREATRIVAAGTSALREAENGADFATAVEARFGVPVPILSGEAEARLVYHGARSRSLPLPDRLGVLDLGGGSVEVALGVGTTCLRAESLPLGFLRLARELALPGALDPSERQRVQEHVRRVAAELAPSVRAFDVHAWLLSGGTARAFGSVAGSPAGAAISTRELVRLADGFAACEPGRLVGLGVEPQRARGFGLGVAVLATLAECFAAPAVRVTAGGLREGLLLRELDQNSQAQALRRAAV